MMKKIYTSSICFLVSSLSFSQTASFAFSVGVPQNEFRKNTDAIGFGGDISIAFPFQKGTPISFGLDFNYLLYGYNSQDIESTNSFTSNGMLIGKSSSSLEVINTNNLFGTHAFVRAQAASLSYVQPYVEGLIGFRYISTRTKIRDNYSKEDDKVIVSKTVVDDWVFSYGYGGGLMIKLDSNLFIDLRVDFFKGGKARYYDGDDTESWKVKSTHSPVAHDPENLVEDDMKVDVVARKSTTDILMVKLGIAFKL